MQHAISYYSLCLCIKYHFIYVNIINVIYVKSLEAFQHFSVRHKVTHVSLCLWMLAKDVTTVTAGYKRPFQFYVL